MYQYHDPAPRPQDKIDEEWSDCAYGRGRYRHVDLVDRQTRLEELDDETAAAADYWNRVDALARHLVTLERQTVTYQYGLADRLAVGHESGATRTGPSDGPVTAPSHKVDGQGLIRRRSSSAIVGSVPASRFHLTELPYVSGRVRSRPASTGAATVHSGHLVDHATDGVMTFAAELAAAIADRVRITDTEQSDKFRLAVTTGLDREADRWMRLNGINDFPRVIGSDYVQSHIMGTLTVGTDQYGNATFRDDVPAHRNPTLADTARSLYRGLVVRQTVVRRGEPFRTVERDGFDVMNGRYLYDDVGPSPARRPGKLKWAPRGIQQDDVMDDGRDRRTTDSRTLADSGLFQRHQVGTVNGRPLYAYYRTTHTTHGQTVYAPRSTHGTRWTLRRRTTTTHTTAVRQYVTLSDTPGFVWCGRDLVAVSQTAQDQRKRETAAQVAVVRTETEARLEAMTPGDRETFADDHGAAVVVSRRADGRWSIRDTRFTSVATTARAVSRGTRFGRDRHGQTD